MAGSPHCPGVAQSGIPARAIASASAMSVAEVFRRITAALDQAGIGYMLSGSFASAYHGSPRSTQDIDLVIEATPAQLTAFVNSLPRDEYYADLDAALEAHRRHSLFNVVDLATGWKIDFIIRKSRAFSQEEFRRRQRVELQGLPIFVASAEDIIIAKLEWSKLAESRRQIEDVAAILRLRWESLDRPYLEKWIGELGLAKEWNDALKAAGK
ncbi:MAG: nucleotidyltransferase family protein [Acidobacteriia bacterium]|nr:nucleotidyltransferase family protein [Terriglobia bacterium]